MMYSKPVIYKIYSVFVFAFAIISFIASIVLAIIDSALYSKVYPNVGLTALYIVITIVVSLLAVFFSYVEFTSMFTFAQMIEHEKAGAVQPFRPMSIVLPAKFYRSYGPVIFYITLVLDIISIISVIIFGIVAKASFFLILLPFIFVAASLVLSYITYFCRYRTFGDLLKIKSSDEPDVMTIKSLANDKSVLLRGYCTFLFVMCCVFMALSLLSILFIGAWGFLFVLGSVIEFILAGIIGCYYDDLGMMLEHYLIRYHLI